MQPKGPEHESWLRGRVDELAELERRIEGQRLPHVVRLKLTVLLLLVVAIGAAVAVSFDPTVEATLVLGVSVLLGLVTWGKLNGAHHGSRALEQERDRLLDQIAASPSSDSE